jgi:hypothetical protein
MAKEDALLTVLLVLLMLVSFYSCLSFNYALGQAMGEQTERFE